MTVSQHPGTAAAVACAPGPNPQPRPPAHSCGRSANSLNQPSTTERSTSSSRASSWTCGATCTGAGRSLRRGRQGNPFSSSTVTFRPSHGSVWTERGPQSTWFPLLRESLARRSNAQAEPPPWRTCALRLPAAYACCNRSSCHGSRLGAANACRATAQECRETPSPTSMAPGIGARSTCCKDRGCYVPQLLLSVRSAAGARVHLPAASPAPAAPTSPARLRHRRRACGCACGPPPQPRCVGDPGTRLPCPMSPGPLRCHCRWGLVLRSNHRRTTGLRPRPAQNHRPVAWSAYCCFCAFSLPRHRRSDPCILCCNAPAHGPWLVDSVDLPPGRNYNGVHKIMIETGNGQRRHAHLLPCRGHKQRLAATSQRP